MARSVLEGIANEKISEPRKKNGYDKDLKDKIKDMVTEEIISKKLGAKANVIKDIGNSSTHNIFEDISEDDAADTLEFLSLVIDEVYRQESQLNRLGRRTEKIKKKKEMFSFNKRHKRV